MLTLLFLGLFSVQPLVCAQPSVLEFDSIAEAAIEKLHRRVIVKFDAPECLQCGQIDPLWDMAGANLASGAVWRVDCQGENAGTCARHDVYHDQATPVFETWNGEQWSRYTGLQDLDSLVQWIQQSISPPRLPQTAQQGSERYFDRKFYEQFRGYHGAFPALVRAMRPHITGQDQSVVDVGCGHGFLVEAWRDSGLTQSYCVEGEGEAVSMWPETYRDEFYQVLNLTEDLAELPKTDYVCTFEVAEHLPESHAESFVQILTKHRPKLIFFGAATVNQDLGNNPTHLNENTMSYWVELFKKEGYGFDVARAGSVRASLMTDSGYQQVLETGKAWWFAKNIMVFADVAAFGRDQLDREFAQAPASASVETVLADQFSRLFDGDDTLLERELDEEEVGLVISDQLYTWFDSGHPELSHMWKRDWHEFSSICLNERNAAVSRLREQADKHQEL